MTDNPTDPASNRRQDESHTSTDGRRTATSGTEAAAPAVALYSTEGQCIAGSQSADETVDSQAQQMFGEQFVAAMVDGTHLYLRLKLVDPPSRPQTYIARVTGFDRHSIRDVGDQIDATIARAGFEYAPEQSTEQVRRALTSVTDTPDGIGDPAVIRRAARTAAGSDGPLRFTAGRISGALAAVTALGTILETKTVALTAAKTLGSTDSGNGNPAALVAVDHAKTGVVPQPQTRSRLQAAQEQLRAERREEALDHIENGIEALMTVESDPGSVRSAVERLLPKQTAPQHQSGAAPARADSTTNSRAGRQESGSTSDAKHRPSSTRNLSNRSDRFAELRRYKDVLRTGGLLVLLSGLVGGAFLAVDAWTGGSIAMPDLPPLDGVVPLAAVLLVVTLLLTALVWQRL